MIEQRIEVSQKIKELVKKWWKAIKQRQVGRFYFESNDGNKDDRDIKPYMVYINEKKEIKVVGVPRELWDEPMDEKKKARHYLLEKIDKSTFKFLQENFNDPGVPREIVEITKKVKVICRFIYDDEDAEAVMKAWVKIEGLIL